VTSDLAYLLRCSFYRCPLRRRDERSCLVVDRSTTRLNWGGFGGRPLDGRPVRRTHMDTLDELNHLAKVRVAGSNPVFRSRNGVF
jgi:hypothetical protein